MLGENVEKLRAQVEAEALVEEAKNELRRLRSRLRDDREELRSIVRGSQEMKRTLRSISEMEPSRAQALERIREAEATLREQCEDADEAVVRKMKQMMKLKERRRDLASEEAECDRQIEGLMDRLERIRRSVAKASGRKRAKA